MFDSLTQWHWFVLGLFLLIGEMLGAAGFLLGIACGALATGVLAWFFPALSWQGQFLIFSMLSVVWSLVYWICFRGRNQETDRPTLNQRTASMVGSRLILEDDINIEGRIQVGDTLWKVRSEKCLKKGDMAEVTDAEVSTLIITKIEANGP
jgi:membrane protein implicated in regulation of membrane protease activity